MNLYWDWTGLIEWVTPVFTMNDVIQWGHLFGHLMYSLLVFPVWQPVCPGPIHCSEPHLWYFLGPFLSDILIGISDRPLSSQFDQFSKYAFVSLWLCWWDSCRTLLPGPHPSQQTLLKRARLDLDTDAQSSTAAHSFPSELMTTCLASENRTK